MVEVECPSCTETVDLGIESSGTYECPYCQNNFEYEELPEKVVQVGEKVAVIWIGIFFAIFTLAALILIFIYIGESGWEETEGEMISSYSPDSGVTGYQYTFMADGETFNGSDECYRGSEQPNCEIYESGDAVMISYNPENPNENEMVDNQLPPIFICFFSLPIIALGSLIYAKLRHGIKLS